MSVLTAFLAAAVVAAVPNTSIVTGPVGESGLATPTFEFTGESAYTFECSLDDAPYVACASPQKVGPLTEGNHTFAVRAVADDGTADDSPAVRQWKYTPSPLGNVVIKLARPAKAKTAKKDFRFISGTTRSTASRVKSVQVAIQSGKPDKDVFPPGCNFVNMRTGILSFRPCVLPDFKTVTGTGKWGYKVPAAVRRKLTPGPYTLIVRAFNAFNQATRRDFKFTLR